MCKQICTIFFSVSYRKGIHATVDFCNIAEVTGLFISQKE